MKVITSHSKSNLSAKAVHLQSLNSDNQVTHNGSGYVTYEDGRYYLYTCWHFVTGIEYPFTSLPRVPPDRQRIRVNHINEEKKSPYFTIVGGYASFELPLYATDGAGRTVPVWLQEPDEIPNEDLNSVNIKIPKWFDLVKILLPPECSINSMQVIGYKGIYDNSPKAGDKVYLVGFPYGFSAWGDDTPMPIVLTRHVAANGVFDREQGMLLDGPGAPGMSGGPVFVEGQNNDIYLTGIYTGSIYPDYKKEMGERDQTTKLGVYTNMIIWWKDINKDIGSN